MHPLRLRAVAGARRGQEFVFTGPRVRIGRSRDNDVILPERPSPTSSGHHAEALLDSSGAWWIVDLNSSNGTRLNDVLVQRHQLKNGDRVTFGDEQFAVVVSDGWSSRWWVVVAAVLAAVVAGIVLRVERSLRTPFEDVAATAARSVFVVATESGGRRSMVGTAFAVDTVGGNTVLATNAHIVDVLQQRGALAAGSVAIQSDSNEVRPIIAATVHPKWHRGSIEADVALVRLAPGAPVPPLPLATASAIAALRRGTQIAAFGFPAVSTDATNPRGRLTVDVVGDVRGEYLEVGLGIAPGTSGSPVFDRSGTVVGIVAGGDFLVSSNDASARPSGSAANWALSADVLREFLERER